MSSPDITPPSPKSYRMAITRPVTMYMLFLTIVVFGWRSYQQLPINLMPDISYPTLTVRTEYEGAAPEDVEKLVTRPLEEMLSIVSGMVEISSVSSPGLSEIMLEFTWDSDMNVAQQDVRDRLDLFEPPIDVTEKPVILRYDPTLDPVMRVAITPAESKAADAAKRADEEHKALTAIRDATERHLKSDLEAEPGIAQIDVKGGQKEEIQILVDANRVKALGLSLSAIVESLKQQNINLSGGRLREGKTEYLVRTLNEYKSVDEIGASIITTPVGQQMRLSDVADVFMGAKERETVVRINGRETVAIDIFKEGDANTVAVCNKVKDLLGIDRKLGVVEKIQAYINESLESLDKKGLGASIEHHGGEGSIKASKKKSTMLSRLPKDIAPLQVITDQSRFIIASIEEVQNATLVGGLLALGILYMFLRELKSTFIIGIAIPISVIATFIPMFARGISLNIMSLGGLALGIGMLVDNSIVVLESVFRCREEGDGVVDAAERGTSEVFSAVISSTLTTVAVFFPIAFVEGVAGQLFSDLALTVTFSLLSSLFAALYLVPLIVSRQAIVFKSTRQVVWLTRAYRFNRETMGKSVAGALLGVPWRGFIFMLESLRDLFRDTFGPSINAIVGVRGNVSISALLSMFAGLLLLPFLVPLFACQVLLRILAVLVVTVLFFITLSVLSLYLPVRFVLHWVFWFPLWLFNAAFDGFRDFYGYCLERAMRFGPIILLGVLAISVHSGYLLLDLGRELIPPMNQGEFGVRMEARAGTRLEETEKRARRLEDLIRAVPEVSSVTVEVGQEKTSTETGRGENIAKFSILLRDPEVNAPRQAEIMERIRERIGGHPEEEITFTLPALFSFKTAIELQVVGDDLNELKRLGHEALTKIDDIPGLKDPELSVKPGYPEIIIQLDREKLASKGISPSQVALRLRTEVQGDIATRFNQGGEKIDIRVRTDQALLGSVEDLRQMSVTDGAVPIPLQDVASIVRAEGPSEIRRIDQRQVVLITANVEGSDLGAVSGEIMKKVSDISRPAGYLFMLGGQNRELETSYGGLRFALILAIFLVYVVMACQFESIIHPMIVMFSMPLAFIGVIYTLYYTHTDLSVMVFLGGIILAGIVVNNAIVLVDYVNQLRARGLSKRKALVTAGMVRMRPIAMTTITTVLGLLPMIWGTGEGSEIRRPLALTIMAGLSSSTLLTLVIIPMIYDIFGGRDKS